MACGRSHGRIMMSSSPCIAMRITSRRNFGGSVPTDANWFTKLNTDERIESLDGYTLNEFGSYDELQTRPEWWEEREKWIAENGPKVEKLTTFWYSGPIYTHINRNLEILWDDLFGAHGEHGEWDLTDTSDFYKRIGKSHGDRSGDPFETFRYSHDHLEVFIPRGGRIRSTPR